MLRRAPAGLGLQAEGQVGFTHVRAFATCFRTLYRDFRMWENFGVKYQLIEMCKAGITRVHMILHPVTCRLFQDFRKSLCFRCPVQPRFRKTSAVVSLRRKETVRRAGTSEFRWLCDSFEKACYRLFGRSRRNSRCRASPFMKVYKVFLWRLWSLGACCLWSKSTRT